MRRSYKELTAAERQLVAVGMAEDAVTQRILDNMLGPNDPLAECGLDWWDTALVSGRMLVEELAKRGLTVRWLA